MKIVGRGDSQVSYIFDSFLGTDNARYDNGLLPGGTLQKLFTNGFDYSDVDYDYSSCDAPECYFEATGFSGVKTISASCAEEAYIIFTIEAKSNSPKDDVKIVITSESEILAEIDANTSIMYKVKSEDDEHIFVKVLGDEADVSVTITRRIIGFNEAPDI